MANAMLDTRQEGNSYRRIEVITGQRRRRRWTAEEKARLVAESFEEGANISEVARRNGVGRLRVGSFRFGARRDCFRLEARGALREDHRMRGGLGLQDAGEALEMPRGMFLPSVA